MLIAAIEITPVVDGRQSEAALAVARGTARLLLSLGCCCVSELPLASGRRADLVALGRAGEIWIVEIKSSIADFRADQKWMDYRLHCDRLFFATTLEVPCEIFPQGYRPDRRGCVRRARSCARRRSTACAPATRRSMMLRFAQAAAVRLQALADPAGPYGSAL